MVDALDVDSAKSEILTVEEDKNGDEDDDVEVNIWGVRRDHNQK